MAEKIKERLIGCLEFFAFHFFIFIMGLLLLIILFCLFRDGIWDEVDSLKNCLNELIKR